MVFKHNGGDVNKTQDGDDKQAVETSDSGQE